MKKWTEPAVGWGVEGVGTKGPFLKYQFRPSGADLWWSSDPIVPVALVPLAVARKAGLLRRPK